MPRCTECKYRAKSEGPVIKHFEREHIGDRAAVKRFADAYGIRARIGATLAGTIRRLADYYRSGK